MHWKADKTGDAEGEIPIFFPTFPSFSEREVPGICGKGEPGVSQLHQHRPESILGAFHPPKIRVSLESGKFSNLPGCWERLLFPPLCQAGFKCELPALLPQETPLKSH